MNVLSVREGMKHVRDYVSQGNGPMVVEMSTYRYHGHSMSDPGSTYRSRDEITGVRQERDPIERVRKLLLEHELATAADLKAIEKRVKKEIDTAVKEAKESPEPSMDVLTHNIYMKTLEDTVRGVERLQRYPS